MTPNHVHAGPTYVPAWKAGVHVICDKPLTLTLAEAERCGMRSSKSGRIFVLTHNYTGYPLVRRAREMVKAGDLGEIRLIQVEYPQDWLRPAPTETTGNKQAEMARRSRPFRALAGRSATSARTPTTSPTMSAAIELSEELAAELTSFGAGRTLDDNVQMMLRYANGARGGLWASQVAPGNENGLRLRIYGAKGALVWVQANPNEMLWSPLGQSTRIVTRGRGPGFRRGAASAGDAHPARPSRRATSKASPTCTARSRSRSKPRAQATEAARWRAFQQPSRTASRPRIRRGGG